MLREHLPPDVTVWVFGSRTDWTTKDSSDLDLALEADGALDRRLLGRLRSAFEESDLPYIVDVVDMHGVSERFRGIVQSERVPLPPMAESAKSSPNWPEVAIGDIADVVGGGTPSTKQPNNFDGGIPWLTPKDLSGPHDRYIGRGDRNLSQQGMDSSSAKLLPTGSVLLSTRAPIGYVALAKNPIATNQGFRSLVVRDGALPEYLYYWLELNTEELERHASGSTFRELSGSSLKDIRLRLPPLDEQRTIARILGALDDKIELNRRMSATLEAMARALFKSWFVDFEPVRAKAAGRPSGLPPALDALFPASFEASELGEIPSGWGVGTLGGLCENPQYGYTQSAKTEPVGPKFLRITDINKRAWVEWESVPHCEISASDFTKYRLHDGDVLIARMADPGHGCMIEGDPQAVFASYLIRFRPVHQRYARFLQYWLRSDDYWGLVSGRGAGTTRVSLNAKVLSGFPLVVPPDPVLEAFAGQVGGLRDRVVANADEARTLAAQRDAMLPRLVSGEMRVRGLTRGP
ncbi:MAG: restriction endonuclease subunit S [Chloroflexi bacterium]|nr:restriction endonuclease subunit S [Chloroflexota bacterium]